MTNGFAAPGITVGITVVLAVVLLGYVVAARRRQTTPTDFYLADRRIGVVQNALALFAAFILFTTLFRMTGHVALNGLDGYFFAAGFAVSWLIALLFFASPLRNVRGHTIGDLFALRAAERPARAASLVVTLLLYATYSMAMMEGAAFVAGMMFGIQSGVGIAVVVAVMGVFATLVVFVGGMLATTRLLAVKAALIIGVLAVLTIAVLIEYRFNLLQLLGEAEAKAAPHPTGSDLLGPGRLYGALPIDELSKLFAVVAGHAALPYMFMRNFAATSGPDARRSVGWAGMLTVAFYACVGFLGLGAVALIGGPKVAPALPARDIALPVLADFLGGPWMVGVLGAVGVLIVVGWLAALLMSAVTSLTRDVRATRRQQPDPAAELRTARRNTVVLGAITIVAGVVFVQAPIHAMLPMTVSLAGASVLPAVLYSLFWKRFNTAGLRWSVFGGLASTAILAVFTPLVTGSPVAFFPGINLIVLPIDPSLISVPVTFLLGYLGTVSSRERNDAGFAELQVRALTGADISASQDRTAPPQRAGETARADQMPSEAL